MEDLQGVSANCSDGLQPPTDGGRVSVERQRRDIARHGDETAELGFSFEKKDDGRVLAREWLSNINACGSAIGFLNYSDRKFVIPQAGVIMRRAAPINTSLPRNAR